MRPHRLFGLSAGLFGGAAIALTTGLDRPRDFSTCRAACDFGYSHSLAATYKGFSLWCSHTSTNVRDMPLIAAHARSESYQPIPAGIAMSPKTLTKDAESDVATLAEIAWQLGIEPTEFARRLAAQPADGE